jgi:hypothetical protein
MTPDIAALDHPAAVHFDGGSEVLEVVWGRIVGLTEPLMPSVREGHSGALAERNPVVLVIELAVIMAFCHVLGDVLGYVGRVAFIRRIAQVPRCGQK